MITLLEARVASGLPARYRRMASNELYVPGQYGRNYLIEIAQFQSQTHGAEPAFFKRDTRTGNEVKEILFREYVELNMRSFGLPIKYEDLLLMPRTLDDL